MMDRVVGELNGMLADVRAGRMPRLLRFLLVGFGGLAVDMGVFRLLTLAAGLPPLSARVASLALATLFTWSLNRAFTFGASGRRRR
ncbi:MAG TPA: GtrA family protein, partial [Thermopetrobacter sp.]|nr:GtrA family protein [Thermopetrobacter sp.]